MAGATCAVGWGLGGLALGGSRASLTAWLALARAVDIHVSANVSSESVAWTSDAGVSWVGGDLHVSDGGRRVVVA